MNTVIKLEGQKTEYRGFKDEDELLRMVGKVDLTTVGFRTWFHDWKLFDGSKRGLREILDEQTGGS